MGLRPDLWFDHDKPGPGTYNMRKDLNDSPKHTMGIRCYKVSPLNLPGPGTYDLTHHHNCTNIRGPCHSMGEKIMYFPDGGVPGPGTYDLRDEISLQSVGKCITMGRRFRNGAPCTLGSKIPWSAPVSARYSISDKPGVCLFQPSSPGLETHRSRSSEFAGPMYTMGQRFYRLRNRVERRHMCYSPPTKSKPTKSAIHVPPKSGADATTFSPRMLKKFLEHFPQVVNVEPTPSPQVGIHRKYSTHVHSQPSISVATQTPSAPQKEAIPPAAPKLNAWMEVSKNLQFVRTRLSAAARISDPESPPE